LRELGKKHIDYKKVESIHSTNVFVDCKKIATDRETERQQDSKTERLKDRKTARQKD
jgi:hypothetical protein